MLCWYPSTCSSHCFPWWFMPIALWTWVLTNNYLTVLVSIKVNQMFIHFSGMSILSLRCIRTVCTIINPTLIYFTGMSINPLGCIYMYSIYQCFATLITVRCVDFSLQIPQPALQFHLGGGRRLWKSEE